MFRLLAAAEEAGYRVYILGASQVSLERAVHKLRREYPSLSLVGYRNGFFSESDSTTVAREVRESGATVLFVAMPSPRKEYFLETYGSETGVSFAMGVGGSIDVVSGATRRAPLVVQRAGLEWLFRLIQEPRRLLPRYTISNGRFLVMLARALRRRF
jgi:N-acetylglucosaminyldiphosphoundecaprenol N-acetyl-beta-D-mannosaminyltransferase